MSARLRLLTAYLRHIEKPWLERVSEPQAARRSFERSARWFFRQPGFAALLPDDLDGVPAIWTQVRPRRDGVILYLHGGAYLMGSPETHLAMVSRLAQLTGLRACLPRYRLAPEHPHPAALEDALCAWDALLARGYPPQRIVLGGDSAGGGLTLALLARVLARGQRPAAVFALSPWTDMAMEGESMRENADRDPLLPVSRVRQVITYYLAGCDCRDPDASPLYARFPAAPPVLLQAARTEILRDDTLRMAEALRREGGEVSLDLWDDAPHVWAIFQGWLPEADTALAHVAEFVTTRFPEPRPSGS